MSPGGAIFEIKLYRKVLCNTAKTHEDLLAAQQETRESSPRQRIIYYRNRYKNEKKIQKPQQKYNEEIFKQAQKKRK